MPMLPSWYGRKYPSYEELEVFAGTYGAIVSPGDVPGGLFVPAGTIATGSSPMILLPESAEPLERIWILAHEIGHLLKHSGAALCSRAGKLEVQADRWAACALIPEAAVQRYKNASIDAFIGALSKHYQDLPLHNCRAREVAGTIARIRLSLVEDRQENNEEAV